MLPLRTLALTAAAAAMPLSVSGQVLSDTDFDANTVDAPFTYAGPGTAGVAISSSNTAVGVTGNAVSATIDTLTNQPDFAGFGFVSDSSGSGYVPFNFSGLLGVTPGAFVASDFADLQISFDVKTSAGAAAGAVRLDVGDFSTGLFLNLAGEIDTGGTFTSIGPVTLDGLPSFGTFLTALNGQADGTATFQASFQGGSDGVLAVGDTITFDNIVLNRVPEPGSMALLGLGATALLARRRNA